MDPQRAGARCERAARLRAPSTLGAPAVRAGVATVWRAGDPVRAQRADPAVGDRGVGGGTSRPVAKVARDRADRGGSVHGHRVRRAAAEARVAARRDHRSGLLPGGGGTGD